MLRLTFLGIGFLACVETCLAQGSLDVRGFVYGVDAKLGTITLELPKGGGLQTYSLAQADVPVRNGRGDPMKLEDVKQGRKVTLTIARATDVAAIEIAPAFKVGTIISANPQTRELEMFVKKEKMRFTIAKDAHYFRSERPVLPPELKTGVRVTIYYLPESNEVIVINNRQL